MSMVLFCRTILSDVNRSSFRHCSLVCRVCFIIRNFQVRQTTPNECLIIEVVWETLQRAGLQSCNRKIEIGNLNFIKQIFNSFEFIFRPLMPSCVIISWRESRRRLRLFYTTRWICWSRAVVGWVFWNSNLQKLDAGCRVDSKWVEFYRKNNL